MDPKAYLADSGESFNQGVVGGGDWHGAGNGQEESQFRVRDNKNEGSGAKMPRLGWSSTP